MTTQAPAPRNAKPFRWPPGSKQAAQLLAEGLLKDVEIVGKLGIDIKTLWRWQHAPEFDAYYRELEAKHDAAMTRYRIARKRERIAALDDRWQRATRVIAERAADPALADVPGGTTGLLVKQLKSIGFGENNTVVEEYAVDTGLLSELRAHEKQAAQELGQWSEGKGGETTIVVPVQVNVDSNAGAVSIAERAYIAALRGERVVLGEAVYEAQSPDPGADAV